MTARFSYRPSAIVTWCGKTCTILEAVTASSVLLEFGDTKAKEVVDVSKLRAPKGAEVETGGRFLDGLAREELAEAKCRFAIIKPLVRCERGTTGED